MKQNILLTTLFTSLLAHTATAQERPNIILFLVDDMGWQDTSLPFWTEKTPLNDRYETPNMERLAAQGMMFTQAYACSVSSPTRASLFTGMNAARHRVTNWTLGRNQSVDARSKHLAYPEWNVNGITSVAGIERATYVTPLSQILKDNGYHTIHCGKAHFGAVSTPAEDPCTLGFDVNIAGHAAGGPGSYLGEKNFGNKFGEHTTPWGIPGLEEFHGKDIFLTEALTQKACAALDKTKGTGNPFFLYMAHYAVHIPIHADKRFYQKYLDRGLPAVEAAYASLVEGMDKSLGDIMDYLEQNDLADNTIILFMSDNGGFSLNPRAGAQHTHNLPLNSGKGSAYEGGIREPMIVSWPGKVKEQTKTNAPVIIEDFYPSILQMAQIDAYEVVQVIDGESFLPILAGKQLNKNRNFLWHFPNNWGPTGPGIGATSTLRKGDWKLIYFHEGEHFELYNIAEDISEKNNLASEQPKRVKKLARILAQELRDKHAQMPINKVSGKVVSWPDAV